jgi:tetratricopeptide (TPR) repeat protein
MKKLSLLLVLCFTLLAPAVLLAQSSVTEMTSSADLQRNLTPEQRAADAQSKAERSMRTAQKKLEALASESDAKKRAKLEKKVASAMERVERDATSSLNVDPRQPRCLYMRGVARLWLGKYEAAKTDCNQAYGIDQENTEALLCYGQAALKADDAEQGMATYRKLGEVPGGDQLRQALADDLRQWAEEHSATPASEKVRLVLAQEAGR